jgi:hypothetical protein
LFARVRCVRERRSPASAHRSAWPLLRRINFDGMAIADFEVFRTPALSLMTL